MCPIDISSTTCARNPLRVLMCLFHSVIILGDPSGKLDLGIAQGCVDKIRASGGKGRKAGWGQIWLDNCLDLVINTAKMH